MPQIPAEKSYFTFKGGLNTESSPINFPEEVTQDETNYEILRDGSRRRRRGLNQETTGLDYTLRATFDDSSKAVTVYDWRNAGEDSSLDFIVVQLGEDLLFYTDASAISSAVPVKTVSMLTGATGTDDQLANNPMSFASVRGYLVVTGRYLTPQYIDYNAGAFDVYEIDIRERDFFGVNDGIPTTQQPTAAVLSATQKADHRYNLRVRGWKEADIDTYLAGAPLAYPAKSMIPWKGYKRTYNGATASALINPDDGVQSFDVTKMAAELFSDASAPKGALIQNPFATGTSTTSAGAGEPILTGWTVADESISPWRVAITVTNDPGLSTGDTFTISGNSYSYTYDVGDSDTGIRYRSLDGTWEQLDTLVYPPGAGPYTITFEKPESGANKFDSWDNQYRALGWIGEIGVEPVSHSQGITTTERPQVVANFAGRVWYMGTEAGVLQEKVFFSRIIQDPEEFGYCYQEADPTSQANNALTPADGGVIVIPGLGQVNGAAELGNSLLIFATNGIWSVGGGNNRAFAADTYRVSRVSSAGLTSKYGLIEVDGTIYYTSDRGIFKLYIDPRSGQFVTESITMEKVDTLWDAIPSSAQNVVKTAYDKYEHRLYFLYGSDATVDYPNVLVYDLLFQAFYKLTFPSGVMGVFAGGENTAANTGGNIKFLVQDGTYTTMQVCDMNQSVYTDWDSTETLPYMITGYDNLQDFARKKQAPVCHVFMQKTETGYTASGTDLLPVNESSVLMQAIWDWSDNNNSGKYAPQQEVYRHRRYYQPTDASDTFDDGYPVVVTRNKLRGSGDVLHLRFDGAAGKDSHILGWSLLYKATRKV